MKCAQKKKAHLKASSKKNAIVPLMKKSPLRSQEELLIMIF